MHGCITIGWLGKNLHECPQLKVWKLIYCDIYINLSLHKYKSKTYNIVREVSPLKSSGCIFCMPFPARFLEIKYTTKNMEIRIIWLPPNAIREQTEMLKMKYPIINTFHFEIYSLVKLLSHATDTFTLIYRGDLFRLSLFLLPSSSMVLQWFGS